MLEKAGHFGGTSAISGGAVWLHDTDRARAEGKSGSAEAMKPTCEPLSARASTEKILPKRLSAPGGRRWPFSSVRGSKVQPASALARLLSG